ncbi:MAG: hypothetical protein JW733_03045 [Coriobacteriia bacterium]|nr:hypothetical protein [Coriobacteriia bacterium]MBN2839362.1 hypothetical protein [Coriobacteriia bacterium]
MRRLGALVPFVIAIAVTFLTFSAIGGWLGEFTEGLARAAAGGGPVTRGDALPILLVLDALALAVTFAISYLGGVSLPSGLPHVALGLFFPLTLAATQARFFELVGDLNGLGDAFGGYNFAAVFLLVIVVAQIGVTLARRNHERHAGDGLR